MSNFSFTNLNIFLPLLALVLFIAYLIVFFFLIRKRRTPAQIDKIDQLYLKLREEIRYSIAPKFVELSLGVNDLVDLAIEVWRMEQRVAKSASSLPEQQLKGLDNSIQKLKRYISKYDIEIVDYKNQKYNDGLNLDILSVEKDPSLSEPIIKETVEPTVLCKGQVVRKAKIILINNK
mgnify:CR=1 FL=1